MQIPDEDDYMDLDDYDGEPEDLPSYCAVSAAGDINLAIEEYASPCEEDRGIMAYLGDREMLGKVYSIFPSLLILTLRWKAISIIYKESRCYQLPPMDSLCKVFI